MPSCCAYAQRDGDSAIESGGHGDRRKKFLKFSFLFQESNQLLSEA
jgi:hypothetical protein